MASLVQIDAFKGYDVTTAGYTYGRFQPQFRSLPKPAKTSGSSTTTVDVTSGDNFASPLAVGDELWEPSGELRRSVTAKASDASITVSSAWDLGTGKHLHYRKFYSGTAATDGWIGVGHLTSKVVILEVATLNATSVTFTIEGRVPGSSPTTIYSSAAQTAVTVSGGVNSLAPIEIPESVDAIRIGVKVDTATGAQSVSARVHGVQR